MAGDGQEPWQVLEAISLFNNDPDMGGPDGPLDHEDYHDLPRLGLWPEGLLQHAIVRGIVPFWLFFG